jgi:poly-gamma-glutamate synthesis protein (capsule biosynthesis protein)
MEILPQRFSHVCRFGMIVLILLACNFTGGGDNSPILPSESGSFSSAIPTIPLNEPEPTSEPLEQEAVKLWIAPYLAEGLTQGLVVPLELDMVEDADESDLQLDVGDENPLTHFIYAFVAPFPTVTDSIELKDIRKIWIAEGEVDVPILMSEDDLAMFSTWWGSPHGDGIIATKEDKLLDYAWENRPIFAIIPFENLDPQWKVIEVDGISPIEKDFDPETYSLSVPISMHGVDTGPDGTVMMAFESLLPEIFNRDATKLTTVVVTGVTALVRATAWEMEYKGITYPATDVGEMMREADLTHISNEVPFVEKCPDPDPGQTGMIFCSDPQYMELLKEVGTDVVELTGDHFGDWGSEAVLFSLALYAENGLPYYGSGATPEEGRQAITFEHNGNQIAFIGCNGKGGGYAPGSLGLPGAVGCDFDFIAQEIESLISEDYVVIFTFQHNEVYNFVPGEQLMRHFREVARYGAQIVSGSQAHQPHNIEFYEGSMLMYGLGNLFFDQVGVSEDTARALIARHVIYDGRHISTELFTIYFSDYSRPRYMNEDARIKLLTDVFEASGW